MRLISLTQPWATLVAVGLKKFETRSWSTPYRGELVIHATKSPTDERALELIADSVPEALSLTYVHGAVIAVCDLVSCQEMTEDLLAEIGSVERAMGDWRVGRYALRLNNVRQLSSPLIVAKGARGVPITVSDELQELITSSVSRQRTSRSA